MKIGILRETIRKNDERVAIVPNDAQKLLAVYKDLTIKIQPSDVRCFANATYKAVGVEVNEDISDCDLFVGVKEVDSQILIPNKAYVFFAHVAKEQSEHKNYFKALASKQITLIDYEYFTNENHKRLTYFGYWAGIVGAYNAIQAVGKKMGLFNLPNIIGIHNLEFVYRLLAEVEIPNLKFLISGNGSSAQGVVELFRNIGIQAIDPLALNQNFNVPVYCVLTSGEYIKHKKGSLFTKSDYYQNPSNYYSIFDSFAQNADVYLPCHFWDKQYPGYLNTEQLAKCKLKVIADISCDISGPIASSVKETTQHSPFYDFNPETGKVEDAFSSFNNITVMTVPNLPAALAVDASVQFSNDFCAKVIPELFNDKESSIINRATILRNGKLTHEFSYLYNFLKE